MRARCGWCGVFVRADTEPIVGPDANGVLRAQILCPGCAPHWVELAARNAARLRLSADIGTHPFLRGGVGGGAM